MVVPRWPSLSHGASVRPSSRSIDHPNEAAAARPAHGECASLHCGVGRHLRWSQAWLRASPQRGSAARARLGCRLGPGTSHSCACRARIPGDAVLCGRRCDPVRCRLDREHGRLSLLPLTLGDIYRELALERGPPARVGAAASMVRGIRSRASRSISAVVATVWPAISDVVSLRPDMEGGDEDDDACHDHRAAQDYRPAWGSHRVNQGGDKPCAGEREGRDRRSRELRHPWTRDGRR